MGMSETVLILAVGTAVIAILFGARVAMRAVAGGASPTLRSDGGEMPASAASDVAGVIALPPFIFLGFLVAATVLEAVVPFPVLGAHALARFVAAGTNIPPNLPTTALVVDGIYGRTRNPLYLGTTLLYLGLSVAAGSLWAIVLVVPLLWVINVGVIVREERYLERKFGDAYRAYKGRVRRWV